MRNSTGFTVSFMILALVAAGLNSGSTAPQDDGGTQCLVEGRIEILNARAKLSGGRIDASDVAVWLTPAKGAAKPENLPRPRRILEQRDKRFLPHVMIVQAGTEIDFPNRDPFFHNVFSVYDGRPFDLGLYASGESRPVRFDRPGISYIFCNIHPQMNAVVVTIETPYFALSNPDGRYSIRNVPAGNYELRLWHERSDELQLAARNRTVSLAPSAADLGVIQLDETGFIPIVHRNKHGEEYDRERGLSTYGRP